MSGEAQLLVVGTELPLDLLQGERCRAFGFEELEDHQLIGRRRDLEGALLDRFDEPFARGGAELRGRQAAPRFRFQDQDGLGDGGGRQIVARDQLLQSGHDRRIAVELGDRQQQLMIELAGILECLGERFQGDLLGREILVTRDIDGDEAGEAHVGVVGG